ncbi:MAG: hypothetical protein BWX86_03002 [Verrucomicrobia bacterium ADurb.Bin122]|nr:MAG: hypothetical protein BWX86_03002 [Verrucomicrobia bacterium ADurb.Bin122]
MLHHAAQLAFDEEQLAEIQRGVGKGDTAAQRQEAVEKRAPLDLRGGRDGRGLTPERSKFAVFRGEVAGGGTCAQICQQGRGAAQQDVERIAVRGVDERLGPVRFGGEGCQTPGLLEIVEQNRPLTVGLAFGIGGARRRRSQPVGTC